MSSDVHTLDIDLNCSQGFVSAVSHMRSFVPAIYDCTVAVPKDQPPPTILRILRGKSSVVGKQNPDHFI